MSAFPLMLTPGKIVADRPLSLRLGAEHLSRHIALMGGTGEGKSKLVELLCRQLASQNCGFTLIDPHGDTADAMAQWLTVRDHDPKHVHYLRPGPDRCFAMDPFAEAPRNATHIAYEAWLTSTVDRVFSAFQRNIPAGDRELFKRQKRWFRNIGYVCGYDVHGKHAGLSKAMILVDPDHPEFEATLARVRPQIRSDLGREILLDFEKLRATKGAQKREQWLESTINLLRDVIGIATRLVFGQHAKSISQRDIILNRGIQLVNLAKSHELSREQGNGVGGLIINSLIHAAENLGREFPFERRVPHYLIVDEAENFVGDDLRAGFGELRKFRLSLFLAFQDLSSLRKGDVDMLPKVISQCGLQMSFHQGNPDDIEYLGKAFGYGALDFTPLLKREIIPDGYDFVALPNVSTSRGTSVSRSVSRTESHAQARSRGMTEAEGINEQISLALSLSHTEGDSYGWSRGSSTGTARGRSYSESDGETDQKTESRASGTTESTSHTDNRTHSQNAGESHRLGIPDYTLNKNDGWADTHGSASGSGTSESETKGETHGDSFTRTNGWSDTESSTKNKSRSGSRSSSDSVGMTSGASQGMSTSSSRTESESNANASGRGESLAKGSNESASQGLSISPLSRHREEWVDTGNLKRSVQDQLFAMMNRLATLAQRVLLCKCKGMGVPFLLSTHDVLDPYVERRQIANDRGDKELPYVPRSGEWRDRELRAYLDRVFEAHDYNFVPDQSPFAPDASSNRSVANGSPDGKPDDIGSRTTENSNDAQNGEKPHPYGY